MLHGAALGSTSFMRHKHGLQAIILLTKFGSCHMHPARHINRTSHRFVHVLRCQDMRRRHPLRCQRGGYWAGRRHWYFEPAAQGRRQLQLGQGRLLVRTLFRRQGGLVSWPCQPGPREQGSSGRGRPQDGQSAREQKSRRGSGNQGAAEPRERSHCGRK